MKKDKDEIEELTKEIFNFIAGRIAMLGSELIEIMLKDFLSEKKDN